MLFGIALGGAVGTLARFGLQGVAQRYSAFFPYGTLTINVIGSLILGFLVRYLLATPASPEMRGALTIGFCGGFTTFSTFSYETAAMLESGSTARAALYVTASVALSLAATFGGFAIARAVLAPPR
jgi:fluoride exporter